MTKKEILAMKAGRELNIRVAEDIMGRRVIQDDIFGDMEIQQLAENEVEIAAPGGNYYGALQPYSEDSSIAQQVMDRLESYNPRVEFNHSTAQWEADFGYGVVSAITSPEAICKAALLAVWETKEEEEVAKDEKMNFIDKIVEIELDMFERVRTAEPSLCKDRPETFKVMRRITHFVLSTETLESYLGDLQKARAEGRNLLTEKYARMDKQIPPIKVNPAIDEIVKLEGRWMRQLSQKYPHVFKGRAAPLKSYLASELETYSDKTLELYLRDVSKAEKEGRNLAEERYTRLFQQIGYSGIAEVDERSKAENTTNEPS